MTRWSSGDDPNCWYDRFYSSMSELIASGSGAFRKAFPVLIAGSILAVGTAYAASEGAMAELDSLTRKWLTLRKEIRETRSSWDRQERLLSAELRMLKERRKELKHKLENKKEEETELDTQLSAAEAKKDKYEEALEKLGKPVREACDHLQKSKHKVPQCMVSKDIETAFSKLPPADSAVTVSNVSDRLQVACALYSQLEELDNNVHVNRCAMRTPDGHTRQCRLLFLGLGRGFALQPGERMAAVGSWTGQKWTWRWEEELAPAVEKAIDCYRKDRAATFVNLPVEIGGETQ